MPNYEVEIVNTPKPDRFQSQTAKLWSEDWELMEMFVGQSGTMTAIFRRGIKTVTPKNSTTQKPKDKTDVTSPKVS